jgi:Tol biopolymer transport system component
MRNRAILFAAAALWAMPGFAQETKAATRLTTEYYFDLERIASPRISPDGAHVVYCPAAGEQD